MLERAPFNFKRQQQHIENYHAYIQPFNFQLPWVIYLMVENADARSLDSWNNNKKISANILKNFDESAFVKSTV